MPVDLLLQDDVMDKDPLPDVQLFPDQVPMLRSAVKKRMTALMMLQVTLILFYCVFMISYLIKDLTLFKFNYVKNRFEKKEVSLSKGYGVPWQH